MAFFSTRRRIAFTAASVGAMSLPPLLFRRYLEAPPSPKGKSLRLGTGIRARPFLSNPICCEINPPSQIQKCSLRVLQFNTLGKHLAEVVQFPYAVDVARESTVDRGDVYASWANYGINDKHWLWKALSTSGTPSEYLLRADEGGTFGVEEAKGKYIYSWSERFPQLVDQIAAQDPDIVFLQEVEVGTVSELCTALKASIRQLDVSSSPTPLCAEGAKFKGIFAPRSDRPTSDGIVILWNTSILEQSAECELLRYTDKQKLALLQQLQVKGTDKKILAVTTHLHWNPVPRGDRPTLQEVESAELVAKIDSFSKSTPVLLGGDLNCGIENAAYKQLLAGGFEDIDAALPESQRKKFTMHVPRAPVPKLTDARRWAEPDVTKWNPCLSDYVLVRGLPIAGVEALSTGIQGFVPGEKNGLPNKRWSASDHFPIGYIIHISM